MLTMDFKPSADTMRSRLIAYGKTVEAQLEIAIRQTIEEVGQAMDRNAPVDTGALKADRSPVTQSDKLTWGTGYSLEYAPILEYGGYRGVGPKTLALGGGDLGAGFVAGAGVYSKQAPLGWVRKSLAVGGQRIKSRVDTIVQKSWGGGAQIAASPPPANVLNLNNTSLGQLFNIHIGR